MGYIDSLEGSLVFFIVFVAAAVFIPGVGPSTEVETVLTISTFLFAILAGFFLTRVNARYNIIRECTSEEDGCWLTLYKISQIYGERFSNKIRDLIDAYYIVWIDLYEVNAYKKASKHFLRVFDEVAKLKKHKGEDTYAEMISRLSEIEKIRNKSSVTMDEKMSYGQWLVLVFLSGIIIVSMFYLKTPEFFSQFITILLSTVLALVILIVRDLEKLRLYSGTVTTEESGQEVLEFIGKKRYYNKITVDRGLMKIPKHVTEYRLGLHKPGEDPKIKLVRRRR